MIGLQRQVARLAKLRERERREKRLRSDVDVQIAEILRVVMSLRPLSPLPLEPERNLKP